MALLTPEYLQTQTYSAQRDRAMLGDTGLQEGVIGATDLKVSQRAAGANMSVDIAAGTGWVKGDTVTRQGLYHTYNDAVVNAAVTASHGSLPRIDQVGLRINDSTHGAGSDTPALEVLAGTATSGATLDNRNGAATLPASWLRLADVLVPAGSSSVTNANIRDRRPWARGAVTLREDTTLRSALDYSPSAEVMNAQLSHRVEIGQSPWGVNNSVSVWWQARINASALNVQHTFTPYVNGVVTGWYCWVGSAEERTYVVNHEFNLGQKAPGSYVIGLWADQVGTAGTLTFQNDTVPMEFRVRERIGTNADNS
jgi:hypothetical protein